MFLLTLRLLQLILGSFRHQLRHLPVAYLWLNQVENISLSNI